MALHAFLFLMLTLLVAMQHLQDPIKSFETLMSLFAMRAHSFLKPAADSEPLAQVKSVQMVSSWIHYTGNTADDDKVTDTVNDKGSKDRNFYWGTNIRNLFNWSYCNILKDLEIIIQDKKKKDTICITAFCKITQSITGNLSLQHHWNSFPT